MLFYKFFKGVAVGMSAFTLLWNYSALSSLDTKKDGVSESWKNVGKSLRKAMYDYEQAGR